MPIALALSLIILQALVLIVHLAVYAAAATVFFPENPHFQVFQALFIALSFTLISATFLSHWFDGVFTRAYYKFSVYWFGLVHFLFGGVVIFYFVANAFYSRNYYVSPNLLVGIVFAIFFLIHLYGTVRSGRADVTRINVTLPNLPSAWRDKRIVFLSDVHLGHVRGAHFMAKIVRKIQALTPEAVLIGGDLYDGVRCEVAEIIEPLRTLRPPRGVYFVTGNHEYFLKNVDEAFAAIKNVGIRILHNEKVDLSGIELIGVDYKTTHKKEALAQTLARIHTKSDKPSILLKHEPDHLEVIHKAGVSLTLAGHTHRGQIFPLNFFTWQIYKGFDYGLKRLGEAWVYTSSGVGTWGPPLRLGTKSEIILITFK